jgi:hypothetical protein
VARFVEGQDRQQVTLLPECLDDFVAEHNPVRVVDAFVAELNLAALGSTSPRMMSTNVPLGSERSTGSRGKKTAYRSAVTGAAPARDAP